MRRFYIQPSELKKEFPTLHGADVRHIKKVLRLVPKEQVVLFDGYGHEFTAELVQFGPDSIRVSIQREIISTREPDFELTVAQGFLKDKKMDELVRHLTELGMLKWIPVTSSRSIPHPPANRMDSRIERWRTIAIEALKQCGGSRIPEILPPVAFEDVMAMAAPYDIKIVFWENATDALEGPPDRGGRVSPRIFALLGPEGGLSSDEIDYAKSSGFRVSSLGPRILRAETAAISACALIQYLYGGQKKS